MVCQQFLEVAKIVRARFHKSTWSIKHRRNLGTALVQRLLYTVKVVLRISKPIVVRRTRLPEKKNLILCIEFLVFMKSRPENSLTPSRGASDLDRREQRLAVASRESAVEIGIFYRPGVQ